MTYRYAIGADDPQPLEGRSDQDAAQRLALTLATSGADNLRRRPEAVLTLVGPNGLVTHPSERLDAFVERWAPSAAAQSDHLQPGDSDAPDCNAD